MQIEILNSGEILVNQSTSRETNLSVSLGTKSNWDLDWIRTLRYLAVQIHIEIFSLIWVFSWLKTPLFLGDANVIFCPKNTTMHASVSDCTMTLQVVEPTTFVLHCRRWYHSPTNIFRFGSFREMWRTCVIYRDDWLSIKFCENDSFRKLFLFFENTFQYLHGISQDISVSHFDSRRSLTSANRRRSTSPIFFVSFTQPCDQQDRKIPTICKSAAWWRGRRARGYRKLILRANMLYVPHIKM